MKTKLFTTVCIVLFALALPLGGEEKKEKEKGKDSQLQKEKDASKGKPGHDKKKNSQTSPGKDGEKGKGGKEKSKKMRFFDPQLKIELSLPDSQWKFQKKYFSLSSLALMTHPPSKATAYIVWDQNDHTVRSPQHFKETYTKILKKGLEKSQKNFKLLSEKREVKKNYLFYGVEFTAAHRPKPTAKERSYRFVWKIYIFGEKGFGQRMVTLIMAAPKENFDKPYVQQSFAAIEKSFDFSTTLKPFPYFSLQRVYLKLAASLGGGILVLILVIFYFLKRKKKRQAAS